MDIKTIITIAIVAASLGGWGARLEYQQQSDIKHQKESCLKWCIERCQKSCEANGVPIANCECSYCYTECSF